MAFWDEVFRSRTQDWVFSYLSPEQVPDGARRRPVEPKSSYLSIFLKSARVVNVRRGLSRFYGTVHSGASVPHLSGELAEFQVVTTPDALRNVDAARIDRVVSTNRRLLGPVPYRGGDLGLEVGLFSIKSADFAAPFVALLEAMSQAGSVAFLGGAVPLAEPIKTGVNLLLGGQDPAVLEIGLSASFSAPETGYMVVMRAPRGEIDVPALRLTADDYRLTYPGGGTVQDYPYMVLKVEASSKRDDWFRIPELAEAHNRLADDVRAGRFNAAKDSFTVFKQAALFSYDLLDEDAQRLVTEVRREYEEKMAGTLTGAGERELMRPLSEVPLYSD